MGKKGKESPEERERREARQRGQTPLSDEAHRRGQEARRVQQRKDGFRDQQKGDRKARPED